MTFRTLLVGDVVGKPGRDILAARLPELIEHEQLDFVVINAENVAGGSGITPPLYKQIRKLGADVITMGDHCFRKKESIPLYKSETRLLRPANVPDEAAGCGWSIVESRAGHAVATICLQGRTFLKPIDCPFHAVDRALSEIGPNVKLIIVDMHAEATSDKVAMGWYLDGKATVVFGTHTHIQTADERVLPEGTAFICDLGMTGPYDSVLGRDKNRVLSSLTTGMPTHFDVATDDVRMSGAIVEADPATGRATSIRRVTVPMEA